MKKVALFSVFLCMILAVCLYAPAPKLIYRVHAPSEPPPSRERQIQRLKQRQFDLLVIGGGATGAGIALDAASRGLKVALVERDDFASETSSRSTKLIHGGVRYLEKAVLQLDREQWNLVLNALQERKTFLEIAPHLTQVLPIVTPVRSWKELAYVWAGLKLYDWLAGGARVGYSEYIDTNHLKDLFPELNTSQFVGAVRYYDGQFNDARMNVALALSAVKHGAVIANHCEVQKLLKSRGKLRGVRVTDQLTGQAFDIAATQVINATGPFADEIRRMDDPRAESIMAPSAGAHVTLPMKLRGAGLLIPQTSDGRVLFVLPWEGQAIAGTTDTSAPVQFQPQASSRDCTFILDELKKHLGLSVSPTEVCSSWSGLRPLVKSSQEMDSGSLSREHVILRSDSGLMTIVGGKWTTYRSMAEEAVNQAVERNQWMAGPCITRTLPVVGATPHTNDVAAGLKMRGVPSTIARYLAKHYGNNAQKVTECGSLDPLVDGLPYTEAEIVYCLRYEYARTVEDLLARRLRLAFLNPRAALEIAPTVMNLIVAELGDVENLAGELERAEKYLSQYVIAQTEGKAGSSELTSRNVAM